jgi:hypothetical protein
VGSEEGLEREEEVCVQMWMFVDGFAREKTCQSAGCCVEG